MDDDKRIKRIRALEAATGVMEAVQRMLSRNFTLLTPRMGMEPTWDYLEEMRRTLQEMMAETKAELMDGERRHVRNDV